MKYILALILFGFPFMLRSQELRINSNIGYATGETSEYKKLMLSAGGSICYEFPSHKPFYVSAALGWGRLIFNTTADSNKTNYVRIKYVFLPVSLRKYYILSERKSLFFELGILTGYYYHEIRESRKPDTKESISMNIFNAGFAGGAGYKHMINRNAGFELGVFTQNDLFQLNSTGKGYIRGTKKIISLTAFKKIR